MRKKILTEAGLHILIVVLFAIISFVYFKPIFEGKELYQQDHVIAKAISNELAEFEKKFPGETSQWTNSMFGGIPAYQIKGGVTYNIFVHLQRFLRFGMPYSTVSVLFMYLLGFYILLVSLKFNKWISILGAVAFAFASYNLIIIMVGHITKAYAIAYMGPAIAGLLILFDRKYWIGGILLLFGLGLEFSTNHIQITYYLFLFLFILFVVKLYTAWKEKDFKHYFRVVAIFLVTIVFAILPNITTLWTTYEYGKESIRGKSELSVDIKNKQDKGLDKNYAWSWSYGVSESLSLVVPNVNGGGSDADSKVIEYLKESKPEAYQSLATLANDQNQNVRKLVNNIPFGYWGLQPFTAGPVYFGAIICFLFVLGLFVVNKPIRWWLLAGTMLGIFLALGRHFTIFNDLFFDYVPFYNKFRTPSMALALSGLTVAFMAMYTLNEIVNTADFFRKNKKYFFISLGITGGIALILLLIPNLFINFTNSNDLDIAAKLKQLAPDKMALVSSLFSDLESARVSVMRSDAFRSLAFILLGAGIIYLYSVLKFNKNVLVGSLIVLVIVDLWVVDLRYLSDKDFKNKSEIEKIYEPYPADMTLTKETDPNFRVLNLLADVFNDGLTSYYHKSIGGYHAAKLRRYQDVIDNYLNAQIYNLRYALYNDTTGVAFNAALQNAFALNMLNTKYIIIDPNQPMPTYNKNTFGNAWFVSNYKIVANADEELKGISEVNLKNWAVIDKRFDNVIKQLPKSELFTMDTGRIDLSTYKPNHISYKTFNTKDQLAVFSEIYYPYGWNAYIDGKLTDHIRVDYILRGLLVPKGSHVIDFKFEPKTYSTAQTISLSTSLIILLIVLGYATKSVLDYLKKQKEQPQDETTTVKPGLKK